MSDFCAVPGCEQPREGATSYCADHGPKVRTPKPFSEQSGCGLALVVLVAAVLLGFVIMIVRAVL